MDCREGNLLDDLFGYFLQLHFFFLLQIRSVKAVNNELALMKFHCQGSSVIHQTQSLTKDSQESHLHANPTTNKHEADDNLVKPKICDSMFDNDRPSPDVVPEKSEKIQDGEDSSAPVTGPAEDGYNWRSYGRKQVKSSERPRRYYKCTHPNCPAKKTVECSLEGRIKEIVYKGSHSHPLQFNDSEADGLENFSSKPGPGIGQFQDMHSGDLETKLSGSLTTTEIADTSVMESMDVSSTLSSNEKSNRAMHGAVPSTNDMNEVETESKRRFEPCYQPSIYNSKYHPSQRVLICSFGSFSRKMEIFTNTRIVMPAAREPRIVVQTTSEVDILDDGYRWRKYGQKVVKGNPNPRSVLVPFPSRPSFYQQTKWKFIIFNCSKHVLVSVCRSYYKCTYEGCSVRKHVERASNDLKSVITMYEGKHNHEVPAASSIQRRREPPGPPQFSMLPLSAAAAGSYGSLCLPPQLSAAAANSGGFSFGMLPPGMAMPVPSMGNFMPMPAQVPNHGSPMRGCAGLMLPRGEEKVNPEQQSRLPIANGNGNAAATYYQQLMGRWPQSHQM